MKKRILSLLLCLTLALAGCKADGGPHSADLMEGVAAKPIREETKLPASGALAADFAVRLLQQGVEEGKNTLLSPLSVLCALGMTANGARGETLAQMEEVLGLPAEELNRYLHACVADLPSEEKCSFHLANAIWFTDDGRFTVRQDFLQANADWYGAGIYQAPFDQTTCDDINAWVNEQTEGMVQDILDQIPADAVMYLVNALAFDGEWESVYKEHQVREGRFTTEDGQARRAELMWSQESVYLADEYAQGFLKPYKGGRYAFAALLPEEGTTMAEYAATLTGERLEAVLAGARSEMVDTAIPKFESEYSADLGELLATMGMPAAFGPDTADFSGLGTSTGGNIFISRVLHKTYMAVDERGTKAGAATVVEMDDGCAAEASVEPKRVILDRPFLYLLVDCETSLPLFIGTMMDTGK